MTALDVINGGAGTDTLSIVDTAGALGTAPSNVTLTSIEAVSISTTGDLGVVGVDAVTASAAVKEVDTLAIDGTDVLDTFTIVFNGVTLTSTAHDVGDDDTDAATLIAGLINAAAGETLATAINANVVIRASTAGVALDYTVTNNDESGSGGTITTTDSVDNEAAVAAVTGVEAAAYDVSGMAANMISVVLADTTNLKAAATSDVNVSGVTGTIVVDGGKNATVADSTSNKAITVSNAKGAVSIADSKQGTAAIIVNDGTNVTITAGSQDNNTSTITVGDAADAVTGVVVVNATGKAYAAGASETFGAVTVRGGTTVNVNLVATSDNSKIAKDTSAGTHTFGAVRVDAEDGTTEITIVQDAAVAAVNYEAAVVAKAATQKLTMGAMASGDVWTLTFDTSDSLSFTASRALTAAEAANAFANYVALATEGKAPRTDGFYTSAGTIDKSWTSGAVTTNTAGTEAYVTFSTATASPTDLVASVATGSSTFTDGAVTAGATANQAVTGRVGVVNSAIDINGATTAANDAVKVVTLTNFASAAIESDVIETLNLTGSAGAAILTTASTGSITVNAGALKTGSQISVDGGSAKVTGMTFNVLSAVTGDLVASAVTDLTINATGKFTSENATDIDAVKTLTVTGAGAVDLGTVGTGLAGTATAINASANTGGLTITYGSDTGTFTGGAGKDVVTTDSETISKAVSLGAGDDTYVLATYSSGTTVSAALDGGEGEDVMSMSSAMAAALDANTVFASAISGFEVLSLGALANSADIVAKNLGLNSKVIVAGTASNGAATISKLAANASVQVTGAIGSGSITLALETATGTSDAINIKTDVDGNLTVGKVIVANVETVNLSAVDKFVDVTGAKDEFDANIANGKDDTNSEQSITLDIDEATTLNITGSADLTVDILDTNNSGADIVTTLVDASTFTGKLTLIADGKISGTTVKGGSGADTLTADGDSDVLIGGAGNDNLTATTLSTLTGGEGNDTFVFQTAVAITNYSTITDLSSGDVIQLIDATTNEFRSTKVTGSSQSSFSDMVNLAIVAATSDTSDQETAWFQFGGNTYLVTETGSNGTSYSASDDVIIEIIGLVDLSKAVFNDTTSTLTIG